MNYTVLTEIRWKADRFEAVKRTLYTQLTAILNAPEETKGALLATLTPIVTAYLNDFATSQHKSSIVQLHRFEVLASDIEKAVSSAEPGQDTEPMNEKAWQHLLSILEKLAFETDITDITLASMLLENRLLIEFLDTVADDWASLDAPGRRATVREIEKGLDALSVRTDADHPGEDAVRLRRAVESMIHTYRSYCNDGVVRPLGDDEALAELRQLRQESHRHEVQALQDIVLTVSAEDSVYLKMTLEIGRLLLQDEMDRPDEASAEALLMRDASKRLIEAIRATTKR